MPYSLLAFHQLHEKEGLVKMTTCVAGPRFRVHVNLVEVGIKIRLENNNTYQTSKIKKLVQDKSHPFKFNCPSRACEASEAWVVRRIPREHPQ